MVLDRTEEGDPRGAIDAPRSGAPALAVHALPMRLGRYTLTKRLGVGGMAEVFLAQQDGPAGFQKTCVVKKILPHLALEPRFVTMFQREARVAALLHHTNVVQTFELGEEDGVYFIAMEYVDGPPLHHLARAAWRVGTPLPMELVACAMADCALGLAAAHALTDNDGKPLGLIHRDISPDNLIINSEGVVKILDFGVAKIESGERTATGELKGKLPFMSPEQIRGDPVDERIDLYALGVTAYWLLTGERPFRAPSDLSLMQTILAEPPRPPRELNPNIPPELDALVLRLLAKDPKDRPPSASAVADALAEVSGARRHVVAPFVKAIEALPASPSDESSPRDAGFCAATPQSSSFALACTRILDHVQPLRPELAAAPTLRMARPAVGAPETEPTGARVLDASATELAFDIPVTRAAPLVEPSPLDTEPSGARAGWRIGAAMALALAVVGGGALWLLRPPAESGVSAIVVPPAVTGATPPAPAPSPVPAPAPSDPVSTSTSTPPSAAATTPTSSDPTAAAAQPEHADPAPVATGGRRRETHEIAARAPSHIQWLDARGHSIGVGSAKLRVPERDKKIIAVDRKRGARTTVVLHGDAVDYAELPRGTLQLRANPYADVWLGKESLGTTPFPPVEVVAGTYTVTFRHNGREEVRTVEVGAGATVRSAVDFGG